MDVDTTPFASPALMVVLRFSGLVLARYDGKPQTELGPAQLMVLQELARTSDVPLSQRVADVARDTGADVTTLEAFLAGLREQGLLLEHAPPVWNPSGPRAATVVDEPVEFPEPPELPLMLATPIVFDLGADGFVCRTHDGGELARLDAVELAAASEFRAATTMATALARHVDHAGPVALSAPRFERLVARLLHARLMSTEDPTRAGGREARIAREILSYDYRMRQAVETAVAAHDAAEEERRARTGKTRPAIIPIGPRGSPLPLALGMIVASALAYKDGLLDEQYQFVPAWHTPPPIAPSIAARRGVFLFSNYIWSHGHNLAISEDVKRANPGAVTIHGGPDAPKYPGDVEQYFAANPHVDVIVHGEGEHTTPEVLEALAGAFESEHVDLSALQDVAGISYRDGAAVRTTAKRDRITDLDTIASPYLTGLFDLHGSVGVSLGVVETNRGCPYGCTFCDWGSATVSRIRKFDLERVFAELEWCAKHAIPRVFLADANFGILERDVEIAEYVADLRGRYGFPTLFSTNYAKNTTKHLRQIVQTLGRADVLTQGLLSLQSMDEETLLTVKRSNIKLEKYEELAREFRNAHLPLFVDLMLGLPGATPASFRDDLQGCVDREITAKIYPTELLINSPMNEPTYRERFRVETDAPLGALDPTSREPDGTTRRALVVSTSSFTRDEYEEMRDMRRAFLVTENLGVLRHVSRFVRQECGVSEVEWYEQLRLESQRDRARWPAVAFALSVVPFLAVAPVSWKRFIDEIRDHVTGSLGIADDSALDTVLRVQHALLPARDRVFPDVLELEHDYTAWYGALLDAKDSGHASEWPSAVPRLREYPPATFTVDDPHDVCTRAIGYAIDENLHADWELGTPLARATSHEHVAV